MSEDARCYGVEGRSANVHLDYGEREAGRLKVLVRIAGAIGKLEHRFQIFRLSTLDSL